MLAKCHNIKTHKLNYQKVSCCVSYLINLYHQSSNNLLFSKFGIFLLRTINHFYNQKEIYFENNSKISVSQIEIILEIICKYSAYYYFKNKDEFSKLLIKSGLKIINDSEWKKDYRIMIKKTALVNNIACVYSKTNQLQKSLIFLDKVSKMNITQIDNAITYNNYAMIYLKMKKIKDAVKYLELMYQEIYDKIKGEKWKDNFKEDNELYGFLLTNYCKTCLKYEKGKLDSVFDTVANFGNNAFGQQHYLLEQLEIIFTDYQTSKDKKKILFPQGNSFDIDITHISEQENEQSEKIEGTEKLKQEENNELSSSTPRTPQQKIEGNRGSAILPSKSPVETPQAFFGSKAFSTEPSLKVKLPFKKKLHIKDVFQMAIDSIKHPKSKMVTIKAKSIDRFVRRKSNASTIQNIYDDKMSKVLNSPTSYDFKETTMINKKNATSVESIHIAKRASVQQETKTKSKSPPASKSSFSNENGRRKATQFFSLFLANQKDFKDINFSSDYIESKVDFPTFDDMNNFYLSKISKEDHIEKEIQDIIKIPSRDGESNLSQIIQDLNGEKYVISIENKPKDKNLLFIIKNTVKNTIEYKHTEEYGNLIDYFSQMFYYNSIPFHCNIKFFLSIPSLVSKVLINHLRIFKKDNVIELGIIKFENGVNNYKFECNFLNTDCKCCLQKNEKNLGIISIYNKNFISEKICFEFVCDDSSVDLLFKETTDVDNIKVTIYNPEFDYKDFFRGLILKIQEILKISISKEVISFAEYVNEYSKSRIIKINCENKLQKKSLWMITSVFPEEKGPLKFQVDYYSLEKIEISNASFYINKWIMLDKNDFINVIGMDPHDIRLLISQRDKITILYILLQTVKMRNIMTKILTERNYDSMIKIIKIKPTSFFRYKFVLIHVKKYFCCAFEFIIYSNELFFLRLIINETLTSRTYAKLYLPYVMYKNPQNLDELKKELEKEYGLTKNVFQDKDKLREVLNEECCNLLSKTQTLEIFENIDVILEKLEKIKGTSHK